jgi:ribosomal subunit interface protein
VDIIFKSRHTEVMERFRKHATVKLAKIEKLDQRAIRVDVEISAERNPRQAGRKEKVELTVTSRGPAIRAEAAAEDRFAALDMALAKLDARLRRAADRRKGRHGTHTPVRLGDVPEADLASDAELPAIRLSAGGGLLASNNGASAMAAMAAAADRADAAEDEAAALPEADEEDVVPVEMQGDGPLLVREKFHAAVPMSIDQALFEMELVGHDFFLFTDEKSSLPSVVYRRRGYQYGVIRLVEEPASDAAPASGAETSLAGSTAAGGNAAMTADELAQSAAAAERAAEASARSADQAAAKSVVQAAARAAAEAGAGRSHAGRIASQ